MATLEHALESLDRIEIVVPPTAQARDVFEKVAAVYDNRKVELTEQGHILVMPPAGLEGGYLSGEVFFQLAAWSKTSKTGKAFDSSSGFYITPNQNRSPDASWVSNERIASIPKKNRKGFAPFCPDFAIEVKSPSNSLGELRDKCRTYVTYGADSAWLIDPEHRTVEIFSAGSANVRVEQAPACVRGTGVVDGFELHLLEIWEGL